MDLGALWLAMSGRMGVGSQLVSLCAFEIFPSAACEHGSLVADRLADYRRADAGCSLKLQARYVLEHSCSRIQWWTDRSTLAPQKSLKGTKAALI